MRFHTHSSGLRTSRQVERKILNNVIFTKLKVDTSGITDDELVLQGQMYGRASLTCDDASPVFPATRHFSSI